jgi:hypothetical protein
MAKQIVTGENSRQAILRGVSRLMVSSEPIPKALVPWVFG